MSTFRWMIIAGLLGMLVGLVCCEHLYDYQEIRWGNPHTSSPISVKVFIAGLTLYEKSVVGMNETDQHYVESGWNSGRHGKFILPPLLVGAVFVGLVGMIVLIQKADSLLRARRI